MREEKLPGGVVALGMVSLCMDTSSELIHSLLPLFLVAGLGTSPATLGIIEGVAEATANITKMFSGVISDRIGRRRPLLLAGYGLAAASKPLFPLAGSALMVGCARFADRIGKGIRGAPRDALIADITPRRLLGAAYGLRQSLDTVGAILGPLLAMVLMMAFDNDFRLTMWIAVIPAMLSVALIVCCVREPGPPRPRAEVSASSPGMARGLALLPRIYWLGLAFAAVLTLARFSEAFILLRAAELWKATALVPLAMVTMNIAYSLSAYPIGVLSDRLGRRPLLLSGIVLLIAADACFGLAAHPSLIAVGAALWGLHMGATQGLLAALVADTAPESLRGTAFGVFNFASGIAMLLASLTAGLLWSAFGSAVTFGASATLACIALLALGRWTHEAA